MAVSPLGVTGLAIRAISIGSACVAFFFAACYASRWPTGAQSKVIVAVLNTAIAANCVLYLVQGKSSVGIFAFALTASYVACVHTPRYLAVIVATATSLAAVNAINAAVAGDPASGFAMGVLQAASVTVVPLTIQMLVQLLAENAVISDIDPLTNLANRRGLDHAVHRLVNRGAGDRNTHVTTTMLDIDKFKSINDTFGHATGDHVLVALSEILRRVCSADSAIARIGGEEFVIVSLADSPTATGIAERLRTELAATPWALTASFGIATTVVHRSSTVDTAELTSQLIRNADQAMYSAKHTGGDHIELARVG